MLTPVDPRTIAFEPDELLRALTEAGVVFVVIGGMGALLHGDIVGTGDLDTAVAEDDANMDRLLDVLGALGARLLVDAGRGELATVDQPLAIAWFRRMASIRLLTVLGILDVVLDSDGVGRFADWARGAATMSLDGYAVQVASLADIIRSKAAAGRAKDLAALPRLRILLRRSGEADQRGRQIAAYVAVPPTDEAARVTGGRRATALAFDVNDTLLDLAALDERFAELVGWPSAQAARRLWFRSILQASAALTLSGGWEDFPVIQRAVLAAQLEEAGVPATAEQVAWVCAGMPELPARGDVIPGLRALRDAGYRVAALTNNGAGADAQLRNAGVRELFDDVIGVDAFGVYKPHPRVYQGAAERLGVGVGDLRLVACHDWDCAGALSAGAKAAFLARPDHAYRADLPACDLTAPDLEALAAAIVATDA